MRTCTETIRDTMKFSIIYSFDMAREDVASLIENYLPPKEQRKAKLWQVTEQGESDLGIEDENDKPWKHWKFCAILSFDEFVEFWRQIDGLYAQDVETMGALGTPACPFGWSPAISFDIEGDSYVYANAYVTPYLDTNILHDEQLWERMKTLIVECFGNMELDDDELAAMTIEEAFPNRVAANQTELLFDGDN